jgi:hypothetical protein
MWKIITDCSNPASVRTFNNTTDLFHPVVNPQELTPLTVTHQFNLLKSFYTRENITNNSKFLLYGFHGCIYERYYESTLNHILEAVTDDNLWVLAYINFTDGNGATPHFYPYRPSDVSKTSTAVSFNVRDMGYHSSEHAIGSIQWAEWFNAKLSDIRTTWLTTLYNKHPDLLLPSPFYINEIQTAYNRYITFRPYCNSSIDNSSYDYPTALQLIHTDPNISLTIESTRGSFNVFLNTVISKHNKAPLYNVMQYSANPLKFLKWPLTLKNEHNPVLYGLELELSTNYPCQQLIDATDDPFFIIKQDSSVTGSKRFKYELATIPMSFKAHRKHWAHWFSSLNYDEFDQTKDTNNGLHIHIAKTAFINPGHIRNFTWFFTMPAHTDFMLLVSERPQSSLESYATIPHHSGTRTQAYLNTLNTVKQVRGCIHLSPKGTIEVRLFRGIVSLAEILKNLEFTDSVFHYTMNASIQTLTLKHYYNWLQKTPKNKYQLIKKYFDQISNLQTIIQSSQLFDIIFNEKKPAQIVELLNKSRLQITQAHITILNKRWKKRTFILDKETGKVTLSTHNHGKLAFLDRSLEKRLLHNYKEGPPTILAATPEVTVQRRSRPIVNPVPDWNTPDDSVIENLMIDSAITVGFTDGSR